MSKKIKKQNKSEFFLQSDRKSGKVDLNNTSPIRVEIKLIKHLPEPTRDGDGMTQHLL